MSLPSFDGLAAAKGTPVTPEYLNAPAWFSYAFQRAWVKEHRAQDGEHGGRNMPQAAGTFVYKGGLYYEPAGPTSNVDAVERIGPGDVRVHLKIASADPERWFPAPVVIGGTGPTWSYEYDDGARTASSCRLRLFTLTGGSPWDYATADLPFRFEAYFAGRTPGAPGEGDAVGLPTEDVRARVAVDGVESAQHRNALFAFCTSVRSRFAVGHEVTPTGSGRHRDGIFPVAAVQVRRSGGGDDSDQLVFGSDLVTSASWSRDTAPEVIRFELGTDVFRGARVCIRSESNGLRPIDDPWIVPPFSRNGGSGRVEVLVTPRASVVSAGVVVF